MKEIKYNNKTIKLPFADADYSDTPLEMETVKNPFSGESIDLPGFAACVYDYTMFMSEATEEKDRQTNQTPGFSDNQDDWQIVRNGLDFFRRYFAKEYMVLLD